MHNSCVCYILHVRQLQGKFYKMIFGFNTRVKPSPIKKESGFLQTWSTAGSDPWTVCPGDMGTLFGLFPQLHSGLGLAPLTGCWRM